MNEDKVIFIVILGFISCMILSGILFYYLDNLTYSAILFFASVIFAILFPIIFLDKKEKKK